jgi:hypothetical protein
MPIRSSAIALPVSLGAPIYRKVGPWLAKRMILFETRADPPGE